MEKKGNAVNLLTLPFWNSLIIFFNLILVLGRGFCFVSVKSRVKFLKFSKMFKMSACLVFQRPKMLHPRLSSPLLLWKCPLFLKVLILLIIPPYSDECAPSQGKVLERDFFLWNGFYSSLDFDKSVLKGNCGVAEILLWRSQKADCNV